MITSTEAEMVLPGKHTGHRGQTAAGTTATEAFAIQAEEQHTLSPAGASVTGDWAAQTRPALLKDTPSMYPHIVYLVQAA